jgi:two-component system, cell cycle sensor histidine kinase and response regulator CckA
MTLEADLLVCDESIRVILDAFPDAVLVVDSNGLIVDANRRAEELMGVGSGKLVHTRARDHLRSAGEERTALTIETLLQPRPSQPLPFFLQQHDGQRPCDVRVSPFPGSPPAHWIVMVQETTERQALEARVRERVKMESVKALAKHMANNFNNALAGVSGHLENGTDLLGPNPDAALHDLVAARRELDRAARVVRALQRVAEPSLGQRRSTDPRRVVEECIAAVRPEFPDSIVIDTLYDHGTGSINADRPQLVDVLVSMAHNARDAMPDGGTLSFRTSVMTAGPNDPVPPELMGREFVTIEIADTGSGIAPDDLPRIFEPFYSTKHHDAAGLGLAGVYEVLLQHEGGITVETAPGVGSKFHIFIPHQTMPRSANRPLSTQQGGTILVVDDELSVRRILKKALEQSGYRVLEATDGDEGLALYDANASEVNLVLLDILMPRMSGWDVLQALKARPEPPRVILQSGYTTTESRGSDLHAEAFLRKPYELTELLDTVREVLNGHA